MEDIKEEKSIRTILFVRNVPHRVGILGFLGPSDNCSQQQKSQFQIQIESILMKLEEFQKISLDLIVSFRCGEKQKSLHFIILSQSQCRTVVQVFFPFSFFFFPFLSFFLSVFFLFSSGINIYLITHCNLLLLCLFLLPSYLFRQPSILIGCHMYLLVFYHVMNLSYQKTCHTISMIFTLVSHEFIRICERSQFL